MNHYFTNEEVKSNERTLTFKIKNEELKMIVDNGVFSKKGLDFGTRTLLESLELSNIKGDVLDFGCGYGPIGIYLAKKTKANIDMLDVNLRSLSLAERNADLNKVHVNIFESDLYDKVSKKYDFIITNPPIRVGKKILYEILFGAQEHLKDSGQLWLVVHKDQGAKSLVKHLEEKYVVEVVCKNKGFFVIKAKIIDNLLKSTYNYTLAAYTFLRYMCYL